MLFDSEIDYGELEGKGGKHSFTKDRRGEEGGACVVTLVSKGAANMDLWPGHPPAGSLQLNAQQTQGPPVLPGGLLLAPGQDGATQGEASVNLELTQTTILRPPSQSNYPEGYAEA